MATIANAKNTFLKRLEILQTASHKSECTLESEFLTKPENYTHQLEHLVLDITPKINLIEGPYLEVLRRPTHDQAEEDEEDELLDITDVAQLPLIANKDFSPTNPKT